MSAPHALDFLTGTVSGPGVGHPVGTRRVRLDLCVCARTRDAKGWRKGHQKAKRWAKVKWGEGKWKAGKRRQRNREEAREKGIPELRMGNDRRGRY